MLILYIIIGIIVLIVASVFFTHKRKSIYADNVYQEFENMPDGIKLKKIMETHPNEELKIDLAVMQIEILKSGYKKGLSPSVAATAMVGALNEMLSE